MTILLLRTLSNSSSKMNKNEKNNVFLTCFKNHNCIKVKCIPPKLVFHNPHKTCLERDPTMALTIQILDPKISGANCKFCLWLIFGFFRFLATTHEICIPGRVLRGSNLSFISSKGCPPYCAASFIRKPPNYSTKWSKTGKMTNNPL